MSTTLAKPAEMADRKWYVIDAAGKPLGRVAAKAAVILRGKNKNLAIKQGRPWILDRLALRATSVLHLAHWRDNVTVQSYLARR